VLNKEAEDWARKLGFMADLKEGTFGKAFQNLVANHPLLRVVFPFVRTPINIFKTFVQYTPGLNLLQREFQDQLLSGNPRERASALGRLAVGASFWSVAIGAAAAGRITGNGPRDKAERDALLASGWQPNSLVVTDENGKKEYIAFNRIEPIGWIAGIAADFGEISGRMSDDEAGATSVALVGSVARNLANKSYLAGLSELTQWMTMDERRLATLAKRRASSYTPSVLGTFQQADTLPEARSMIEAMKAKLEWGTSTIPPKRNLLGEPIDVPMGMLPWGATDGRLARSLSPVAFSKQVDDDVVNEIARLQFGFGIPPKQYEGFNLQSFRKENGQDAWDRWLEKTGQVKIGGKTLAEALTKVIKSEGYQKFPLPTEPSVEDHPRVVKIREVLGRYRKRAFRETLAEFPEIEAAVKLNKQRIKPTATIDVIK
jgi:hypothetical protein